MTDDLWKLLWDAAQKFGYWVGLMLLWIYAMIGRNQQVTQDKLAAIGRAIDDKVEKLKECELKTIENDMDRHERRLIKIESDIEHVPSISDINSLNARIDTLNAGINKLTGRLEGINRAVDLINEFLINQGKSKG